jgi:fatty acid desaturase
VLRYKEDWRSLAVIALVSATFCAQWISSVFQPALIALAIVLALPVAVLAHNHHHAPMWRSRALNLATGYWLTLFYGGPPISWLAMHNRSHHAHENARGKDVTSTHNVGDRNDLIGLLCYVPSLIRGAIREHARALRTIRRRDPRAFWFHVSHAVFLYGVTLALLYVDWKRAVITLIIPQQVAIASIAHFNFFQHAATDDRSRNFVGRTLNLYLFNAGFHAVHHRRPTLHWSLAEREHAQLASDPALDEPSFWGYFARVVLGSAR